MFSTGPAEPGGPWGNVPSPLQILAEPDKNTFLQKAFYFSEPSSPDFRTFRRHCSLVIKKKHCYLKHLIDLLFMIPDFSMTNISTIFQEVWPFFIAMAAGVLFVCFCFWIQKRMANSYIDSFIRDHVRDSTSGPQPTVQV
jgi:hypothetical protein